MNEWKEIELGELCQIKGGKRLPKGEQLSESPTDHPYIRTRDLANNKIAIQDLLFVPSNVFPKISRYIVETEDIIISIVGTIGLVAKIPTELHLASLTENCAKLVGIDEDVLDKEFLFYFLVSGNGQDEIDQRNVGSTQPKLPFYNIKTIPIPIPPLEVQRAIASVLSSLDDKIDLLHRQNQTLEQMAETLFRQWFVENPNSEWEERPLSEFGQIICGKTPSKKKPEYFDGEYPFIKIPDMHGKTFFFDTQDSLSEEGFLSQEKKALPAKSINVSCIATVGLVTMNAFPSQTNQQINSIIPADEVYRYYLHCEMKNLYDLLHAMASGGTATLNLNTGNFSKIPVLQPDGETIERFNELVSPMFDKIFENQTQIRTLTILRDTLLPKVMSGEVRVETNTK